MTEHKSTKIIGIKSKNRKEDRKMENMVINAIKERRSIRAYKDDALTKEQLDAIVEAALYSPSAMNKRSWHITVVTDKALLKQIDIDLVGHLLGLNEDEITERIKSRGNTMLYNAPALLIVTAPNTHGYELIDAGVMAQNIALTAKSLGLDSVIVGILAKLLDSDKGKLYREKFKFLPGHEFQVSILVGTANKEAVARQLTFDDKVTWID